MAPEGYSSPPVYRGLLESISILPYLIVEDPHGKREVPLAEGSVWKIGRSESCAIIINDETISRNHAMVQRIESGYYLVDMGSRNGSFLNGRRVSTPVVLRNGDWATLGNVRIMFLDPSQTPAGRTPGSLGNIVVTKALFTQCLVSVLVVDIRGYTNLAQSLSQPMLCQVIGGWFGEADRILQKRGGAGQKYIGDAVMTLWLHRTQGGEQSDVLQILRALSEFWQATADLKRRLGMTQEFRIGAGLNTGFASVGNPGTRQSMDFTALGDSVNAAFRLETASKELATDVVLGEKSFEYLRPLPVSTQYFSFREASLKGYDAPANTWCISFAMLQEFLSALDVSVNLARGSK